MSNETTENFWKVWTTFKWPEHKDPSYRLYYNDDGTPKCYSMEEWPDKYVEVDAETFARRPWNIRVVDGKLQVVQLPVAVKKLTPGQAQGVCCHPKDVCVVVDHGQSHTIWNTKTHEVN